jgi:XTP/dITP diphosphohydrolase
MDILIGTKNRYKISEMKYFLKDIPNLEIHLLEDEDIDVDVEEDGSSLIENAEKKALEISKYTSYYVLTSDVGNDIPALGDKWDMLRNQRIVGKYNTDMDKANFLLNLMKDLKGEERSFTTYFALALAKEGKVLWSEEQMIYKGYIVESIKEKEIQHDLWGQSLVYYPDFKKRGIELTREEEEELKEKNYNLKERLENFIKTLPTT